MKITCALHVLRRHRGWRRLITMSDTGWYLDKFRRRDIKDKVKGAGAWHAQQQDDKMIKEDAWDKRNVCKKCNMVLTKNKRCPMGCDEE
jgi:hypothetical protein